MPINLTVILGAGAAHDVVTLGSNDEYDPNHHYFRPPITADLFQTHSDWENEYAKFPAVASVVGELRDRFSTTRTSIDIETFLKQLKESPKEHRNAQFREFPLYLQHYFSVVSERYCKKPKNYLTLINQIFDLDLNKVMFVTTNYDLFLDKALEINPSTSFTIDDQDMNKYIREENWAYIKLHGSVDWGRKIKDEMIKNRGNTLAALVDNVRQLGSTLETALDSNIVVDHSYKIEDRRHLAYPAISVPVGESKVNCPDDHLTALKQHLNNCQIYLVIGFSGYDKDLLQLLDNKEGGFVSIIFVSSSIKSAALARDEFMRYGGLGQKLQTHAHVYSGNGFDQFIRDPKGLNTYLNPFRG